jgi:UDP-N-acetyl-D-galactosamine dehydrogenase
MKDIKIGIIGLGYVGLPLAVEFAKKYSVVGYDIKQERVNELNTGVDSTLEVENSNLQSVLVSRTDNNGTGLFLTTDKQNLVDCNYYIITVPTPTDKNHRPILKPLLKASETVGTLLSKGDIVVYESTVYPGATEEDCVPVLEKASKMIFNEDFFVGYSPERINPGDKKHTLTKIKKVTSGSTLEIGREVDELYQSVIVAGTHLAPSIKVAEAAKVIENSQRDINIAFVNELAKIFNLMDINTQEVLKAAQTKWNFMPFTPGLVGGHCIGVDPYYLAQKAQEVGYNPEIILAGRRINDGMGEWVSTQIIKLLISKGHAVKNSKILILGITFKENCPDIRNTKVIDVIRTLEKYSLEIDVYDPWANKEEVQEEYNINLIDDYLEKKYDAVVLAVAHNEFKSIDISQLRNGHDAVIYDIKGFLGKEMVDGSL